MRSIRCGCGQRTRPKLVAIASSGSLRGVPNNLVIVLIILVHGGASALAADCGRNGWPIRPQRSQRAASYCWGRTAGRVA
jgi:hypothetical protein